MEVIISFSERRTKNVEDPLSSLDRKTISLTSESRKNPFTRYLSLLREGHHAIAESDSVIILANRDGINAAIAAFLGVLHGYPTVIRLGGDPWKTHKRMSKYHGQKMNLKPFIKYIFIQIVNFLSFRYADGFITVSHWLRERVIAKVDHNPSLVRVVNSPVDGDEFSPFAHHSAGLDQSLDGTTVILTVSNLSFFEKYSAIRHSFPRLQKILAMDRDIHYIIAGGGRFYDCLNSFLDQKFDPEVRQRIHTLGYVEDVARLYASSDIFIYFSYEDAYPNTVLEAQASALPVIANRQCGMKEQIKDGKTGFLVRQPNEQNVTHTLRQLIENPRLSRSIGFNARESVLENNNNVRVGRQLEEALMDIAMSE